MSPFYLLCPVHPHEAVDLAAVHELALRRVPQGVVCVGLQRSIHTRDIQFTPAALVSSHPRPLIHTRGP
eukprot:6779338-Pyramimonas_sp.AAC.1